YHSLSMISFTSNTLKKKEEPRQPRRTKKPTILWRDNRAGNHFIFQSQVVCREASGILKSVPLIIMADTGASCSVFDLTFIEKNRIPWKKQQNPIRIVSASGTQIPHGGKVISSDCSVV